MSDDMSQHNIDFDEIEDAIIDYGNYMGRAERWEPTRQETEREGSDATMVRIHNAIRKGLADDAT